MKPTGTTVLASNRKARHDFTIIDVVEAGIVLVGSEVKSLRSGQVQLVDAYARVIDNEVWLEGVHIAPYQFAVGVGAHDPDRPRKLLLHAAEIRRFRERIMKDRLTLVPLSMGSRGSLRSLGGGGAAACPKPCHNAVPCWSDIDCLSQLSVLPVLLNTGSFTFVRPSNSPGHLLALLSSLHRRASC